MQIVKNTTILFDPEKFWRRFGAPLNEKSAQLVVLQLVTLILAEREGFEPPVPLSTPVFKTGAFDHSAISPIQSDDYSLVS